MPFRRLLYWPHLITAVATGIVIFCMSLSGVILTYEQQLISWSEAQFDVSGPDGARRLSVDELATYAAEHNDGKAAQRLIFKDRPEAAVIAERGRSQRTYLDPYSGKILGESPTSMKSVMEWITGFHRWFALEGESRSTGRLITATANLAFLFLVLSGIYLWLPHIFKWSSFRKILFFKKNANSHARDLNWHHVLGIWSVIPLFFIIATAAVFYFDWANKLLYNIAGEEPPVGGLRRGAPPAISEPIDPATAVTSQSVLDSVIMQSEDWSTITVTLPRPNSGTLTVTVDKGTGRQPQKRIRHVYNRTTGDLTRSIDWNDNSPGRKMRIFARFLHTGEALGIVGQTIAGIASLFSVILVYTGFALAWRKYISPLLKSTK